MKKILFIAPRFHTNQYYTVQNLMKKYEVFFISLFKGKVEDYKYLEPEVIKQGSLSRQLQIFFKLRFDTLYFPNFFQLFRIFKKIKPDIIILRIYSRPLLYLVSILSKIFKAKIIFYDQSTELNYKNLISFF